MLFDAIPRWASRMMGRGFQKTKAYRLPPMPWGLNADELATLRSFHPNIVRVREVDIGRGRGFVFRYAVRFWKLDPHPLQQAAVVRAPGLRPGGSGQGGYGGAGSMTDSDSSVVGSVTRTRTCLAQARQFSWNAASSVSGSSSRSRTSADDQDGECPAPGLGPIGAFCLPRTARW